MKAVVNATPLIALAAIGRLYLLQDLFTDAAQV
jgi:predicted nucleic acid-binding protein